MNFIRRFFRVLFSWRMAKRLLFAFAALVTLAALLIAEENWRGKRDWQAFVRDHETRNDPLDFSPYIPAEVPEGENFAMTPVLKPLFGDDAKNYSDQLAAKFKIPEVQGKKLPSLGDRSLGKHFELAQWNDYLGGDITNWLAKVDPGLREISEASRRRYARYPLAYEKGFAMTLPHVNVFVKLGKVYALRGEDELQQGRSDAALEDTLTLLRVGSTMKNDLTLVSQLVWIAMWQTALQVVWEGTETHRWTDAQLRALQEELSRANFLEGIALAFHGERAVMNETILSAMTKPGYLATMMGGEGQGWDRAFRFVPSGLIYRNLLEMNRFYETYVFPSINPTARRIYPDVLHEQEQALLFDASPLNISKVLEKLTMPVFSSVVAKVVYEQASTDQAVIACALERYRLAHGRLPTTLAGLVPDFLPAIPLDAVNGQPPHYQANADGTYLLYSDGWDGKDDGGKPALRPNGNGIDIMKGDWPWAGRPE